MPIKRYYDLDIKKRKMIMDTAIRIFSENSFQNASIKKISKQAGLSTGALYYYFEDKVDLYVEVLDYIVNEIMLSEVNIQKNFEETGFWKGITAIIQARNEFTLSNPYIMKLMKRIITSNESLESKSKKTILNHFEDIFEYGYTNDLIRKDLPKTLMFSVHLNLAMSIVEWTLNEYEKVDISEEETTKLQQLTIDVVELIKRAVSPIHT